jgi:hypothetical protein
MAPDSFFPLSLVEGEVGEVKVNTKCNVLDKAHSILDARVFSTKLEIYLQENKRNFVVLVVLWCGRGSPSAVH